MQIETKEDLKEIKESLTEIINSISNNVFNVNLVEGINGNSITICYNDKIYEIPCTSDIDKDIFGTFLSELAILYKSLPLILSLNIHVIEKLEAYQLK